MAYMSQEGYDQLLAELKRLESVERPEISRQIAEVRDKGDLSENAEYDAAKEEQGQLESKIAMLKSKIVEARIIDETSISTDEVQILTKVKVLNLKTNQEKLYQLVPESEANVLEGKLSTTAPIAKGLLGKKVGDVAEVTVPAGKLQFKILEISL
jgi:transcription elongation factor GreA